MAAHYQGQAHQESLTATQARQHSHWMQHEECQLRYESNMMNQRRHELSEAHEAMSNHAGNLIFRLTPHRRPLGGLSGGGWAGA